MANEHPAHVQQHYLTWYSMEAHASHGTPQASIQADWETREFIETITAGIKRIAEFLNNFGAYAVIALWWVPVRMARVYELACFVGRIPVRTTHHTCIQTRRRDTDWHCCTRG